MGRVSLFARASHLALFLTSMLNAEVMDVVRDSSTDGTKDQQKHCGMGEKTESERVESRRAKLTSAISK
jgi:hypothetical protein